MRSWIFALSLMLSLLAVPALAGPTDSPADGTPNGCDSTASVSANPVDSTEAFLASIGGTSDTGCCYSDPCPGWGSLTVSCCENGCTAYSTWVWCPSGDRLCPDPCASNGICNLNCLQDPDCGGGGGDCVQGMECTFDECGNGYCDFGSPLQFPGQCVC